MAKNPPKGAKRKKKEAPVPPPPDPTQDDFQRIYDTINQYDVSGIFSTHEIADREAMWSHQRSHVVVANADDDIPDLDDNAPAWTNLTLTDVVKGNPPRKHKCPPFILPKGVVTGSDQAQELEYQHNKHHRQKFRTSSCLNSSASSVVVA